MPHLEHTCTQALPDIDATVSASDATAEEDAEGVRGKVPFWASMPLTWSERGDMRRGDLERGLRPAGLREREGRDPVGFLGDSFSGNSVILSGDPIPPASSE